MPDATPRTAGRRVSGSGRLGARVSVITVFHNAERFLDEAIHSVLRQTYGNWELLLVDDGSTDRSRDIAESVGHPSVHYLHHPEHEQRGIRASRKLGLEQASGEFFVCLDSDDVLFPHTLSVQVATLVANPSADMTYGSAEYWHSWRRDQAARPDFSDAVGSKVFPTNSLVAPPRLMTVVLRDRTAVPCWCAIAFRTAPVRDLDGFDGSVAPSVSDLHEDQVLFSRIFLEKRVFVSDAILGRYRQHEDQLCARVSSDERRTDRIRFLQWLSAYLIEREIDDESLRDALAGAIADRAPPPPAPAPARRRLRRRLGFGNLR